jgi:hypothetical protein
MGKFVLEIFLSFCFFLVGGAVVYWLVGWSPVTALGMIFLYTCMGINIVFHARNNGGPFVAIVLVCVVSFGAVLSMLLLNAPHVQKELSGLLGF